jgi:hypothetical protein
VPVRTLGRHQDAPRRFWLCALFGKRWAIGPANSFDVKTWYVSVAGFSPCPESMYASEILQRRTSWNIILTDLNLSLSSSSSSCKEDK